jgi:hypothetical protein
MVDVEVDNGDFGDLGSVDAFGIGGSDGDVVEDAEAV